jgi:hypothetical protein
MKIEHHQLAQLKPLGLALTRRGGVMAGVWVIVYLATGWMNQGVGSLFAPLVGALVGLVFGWVLAQDAVETAGFSGMVLWVTLVATAWLAIWIPELLMGLITGHGIGGFGRWMLIMTAMILSMAAAVWRASVDD